MRNPVFVIASEAKHSIALQRALETESAAECATTAIVPTRLRSLAGVDRRLHAPVKGFACLRFRTFARPRPVGVGGDHQTARAIDEDALAEDPARRHRPLVVGPPLEAVAPAGNADILLLGRGLGEPVGRHDLLALV